MTAKLNVFRQTVTLTVVLFFAGFTTSATAQTDEPTPLRAMVFVATPGEILPGGLEIAEGIHAPGLPALEDAAFRNRLRPYLGRPLTMELLNEVNRDVVAWYREQDVPLVDVIVPEQDATNGVVQMIVIRSRVGQVQIEGGNWFANRQLQSQLRLQPDQTIQSSILAEDINWLNRNPFRSADVIYVPGEEFGTTDIIIRTEDRFPLLFTGGYDNTGNQSTGFNRFRAGVTWGNAFGREHIMRLGIIANDDWDRYHGYTLGYIAPLPWRHTISFFGAYQETNPDLNSFFTREGRNIDLSLRYTMPLQPVSWLPGVRHELVTGLDVKRSNNDLLFGSFRANRTQTDIFQWVLSYSASRPDSRGATSVTASLYASPGGVNNSNGTRAFQRARAGSSPTYAYATFSIDRLTRLPADFTWKTRVVGQFARVNLLGSEQMGLGGMYTVRGYDERELNGDTGILLSNEIRTPSVSVFDRFGWSRSPGSARDSFQGLAFLDLGRSSVYRPVGNQRKHGNIASAGVGMRYVMGYYVSITADIGWQLRDSGARTNGDSLNEDGWKGHLSVNISY